MGHCVPSGEDAGDCGGRTACVRDAPSLPPLVSTKFRESLLDRKLARGEDSAKQFLWHVSIVESQSMMM